MQGRLVDQEIKSRIQSFPEKNWIKDINIAKKIGFSIMEWTIDYKKFYLNPFNDPKNEEKLKKILKKNKITVPSITCDFFMQKPFFKQKALESEMKNKLIHLITRCKRFNTKFLIIPLVDNSSTQNKESIKIKVINFFLYFSKILKYSNVKILFETDLPPTSNLNFINRFNGNFGINYDSGNSKFNNFSIQKEYIYFHKVFNVHIKDNYPNGKTIKLGNGEVDFSKLFKLLKKIDYKGNLIFQTARSKIGKHKKEIVDNLNYLKKC